MSVVRPSCRRLAGNRAVKVLVIAEDPVHNGHILKPLVQALLASAGRESAHVRIMGNPRVRGYVDALRVIRNEIVRRYRWLDIWLFFPDADRASRDAMERLEADLAAQGVTLLCCPAQPEVEIYACAAFRGDIPATWNDARRNPRMKEEVFQPLLDLHGFQGQPSAGREMMIARSLRNLPLLFRLCPELQDLRDRIAAHLSEA